MEEICHQHQVVIGPIIRSERVALDRIPPISDAEAIRMFAGDGTYSVLKQIELCKSWNLRYLYLGLYIAESERMKYKARFLPHQRLIDGTWQTFGRQNER